MTPHKPKRWHKNNQAARLIVRKLLEGDIDEKNHNFKKFISDFPDFGDYNPRQFSRNFRNSITRWQTFVNRGQGDYPKDFLDEVGYTARKNNPDNIPGGIRPGSDESEEEEHFEGDKDEDEGDSDDELEEFFDNLYVEDKKKKTVTTKRTPREKKSNPEDDMRRIEVIVQNQVLCPRRRLGIRQRLCCSALLDSGVKINSIEPSIDRANGKIYLTGEYQSTLKKGAYRMGDLSDVVDGLVFPYQEHLNRNVQSKWTMVGNIPPGIEVENSFVDPTTNKGIEDPITIASVPPDAVSDGLCITCYVAQFFILSVELEKDEPQQVRRSRKIFTSPPPNVAGSDSKNYNTNMGNENSSPGSNSFKRNHVSQDEW
eukprot:CAMPEP_0197823344 /NCGR_PEP_ID=MMETSP1437-20131217/685_1 /TAXON_ID=49252 ORGANISM="Eucampia antarctica, Strain CCMP1452" /NCGR_SAMPLE_ID=MMETSP1437 /ASSEMBLY_ACC=CAM_ASM_001096 /LENGTH=369 /DNA_ID=CAMNT_0043422465 /DNA_START=48 /DNA_END=1154 /DNA_ORIENTATION=+